MDPGRPYGPAGAADPRAGGALARGASFPLPVRAERLRWGVRLSSPPVTLLPGDPPLFVAGPQAEGRRRLKTVLLPADGSAPFESWSLLPGEERLVTFDRGYLRLDGAPALAATTFEKIGVFAKKRLRLFLLGRDRSRKGSAPSLAVETDCPLWFRLDSLAADADGDGRQDLVLAHPGGLRGKELLVSAYRSLGGGKFDKDPRRWKLNEQATDWLYGPDLTGDGTPDLLAYVGDHLFLYPGDPKGARPLAGRPLWSFPVPGAPKKNQQDEDDEAPDGEALRDRDLRVLELPGEAGSPSPGRSEGRQDGAHLRRAAVRPGQPSFIARTVFLAGRRLNLLGQPRFWFDGHVFGWTGSSFRWTDGRLSSRAAVFPSTPPSSQDGGPSRDFSRCLRSERTVFLRAGSSWPDGRQGFCRRRKQLRTWSSTMPVACMKA